MSITAQHLAGYRVAYVEYKGDYQNHPEIYDVLVQKLAAWAAPLDLWHFPGRTQLISIYPDDERTTPRDEQRLWFSISVPPDTSVPEAVDVHLIDIPKGLYAVGSFEVKAEEFAGAWGQMYGQWISQNGYEPTGELAFEVQKNVFHEHAEERHDIDICIPIRRNANA